MKLIYALMLVLLYWTFQDTPAQLNIPAMKEILNLEPGFLPDQVRNEVLRREMENYETHYPDNVWYYDQNKLRLNHTYFIETARWFRDEGHQHNVSEMLQMYEFYKQPIGREKTMRRRSAANLFHN